MSEQLSRKDWDNNTPTNVDEWLKIYSQDNNLPYATDSGHLVNIIDTLIERLETVAAEEKNQILAFMEENLIVVAEHPEGDHDWSQFKGDLIAEVRDGCNS